MIDYVVQQGDCLSSIAYRHKTTWQKLWNDPTNSDLRASRQDPNILYPEDIVHIPQLVPKQVAVSAAQRHTFKMEGVPVRLRVQLLLNDIPLANEPFTLVVDGTKSTGTTDGQGWVRKQIRPDAAHAIIKLDRNGEVYQCDLGTLAPIKMPVGYQQRLSNLGFYFGKIDGIVGPKTNFAISTFQERNGLNLTGLMNDSTIAALRQAHKS